MSLAKIVVSGRVVRAPEKRFTPNNNMAVTEFAIQVDSPARPDGTIESHTVKVITWRDLAERCAADIKKGDLVAVDGRLQINNYTTSDGQRRRDPEIDAIAVDNLSAQLGSAAPLSAADEAQAPQTRALSRAGASKGGNQAEELDAIFAGDEEIPF